MATLRRLPTFTIPDDPVGLLAWCSRCVGWHRRGRGGRPATAANFGWRTPHCEEGGGAYELVNQGKADEEILRDARRRKPRGPAQTN